MESPENILDLLRSIDMCKHRNLQCDGGCGKPSTQFCKGGCMVFATCDSEECQAIAAEKHNDEKLREIAIYFTTHLRNILKTSHISADSQDTVLDEIPAAQPMETEKYFTPLMKQRLAIDQAERNTISRLDSKQYCRSIQEFVNKMKDNGVGESDMSKIIFTDKTFSMYIVNTDIEKWFGYKLITITEKNMLQKMMTKSINAAFRPRNESSIVEEGKGEEGKGEEEEEDIASAFDGDTLNPKKEQCVKCGTVHAEKHHVCKIGQVVIYKCFKHKNIVYGTKKCEICTREQKAYKDQQLLRRFQIDKEMQEQAVLHLAPFSANPHLKRTQSLQIIPTKKIVSPPLPLVKQSLVLQSTMRSAENLVDTLEYSGEMQADIKRYGGPTKYIGTKKETKIPLHNPRVNMRELIDQYGEARILQVLNQLH